MQTNTLSKQWPSPRAIIAITVLIVFGSGYCLSQSHKTGSTVKATTAHVQTKPAASVYLAKNDPTCISIKGRTVTDLKQSSERSDPESAENKLMAAQIQKWTEEKKNELQALGEQSIKDYVAQTHFDVGIFVMVFNELWKMGEKKIAEETDIRVRHLGGDTYAAEFWEDGLATNSEANAVIRTHELAASEYARKHPESGIGDVKVIKETFANVRKSIKAGKQERYTKMVALLYTREKDGSIAFHDPGQPMIDFVKNNSK